DRILPIARKCPPDSILAQGPSMPAKPKPRLPAIPDDKLTDRQKELMEAIRSGPRGRVSQSGPFGVFLHAPEFGDLTQKLGAHCRYKSGVAARLPDLPNLCTARQ